MLVCSENGGAYELTATWDPPAGGATGYQTEFSDRPLLMGLQRLVRLDDRSRYGEQNTGADTTTFRQRELLGACRGRSVGTVERHRGIRFGALRCRPALRRLRRRMGTLGT